MNFPDNPQRETQLELALRLASRGYFVFPVCPKSYHDMNAGRLVKAKEPFPGFKWRERSSNDPARIRQMWLEHTDGAVAIDCAKSDLFVVDGDRHKAEIDGVANWRQLFELLGGTTVLPFIVQTPSNGEHWYFRQPAGREPLRNSEGLIADGVDTRGIGGLVLAAGAMTEAGVYRGRQQASFRPYRPFLRSLIGFASGSSRMSGNRQSRRLAMTRKRTNC